MSHVAGRRGNACQYESIAEPIKLGYLFDFKLPDGYPEESRLDLVRPFELVFKQGLEQGMIDRPVEIIFREVEGLPKGRLRRSSCLRRTGRRRLFGRVRSGHHRQLCARTRKPSSTRFQVPAISVTGSEEWLGEWTFSLSMGSMTDEPIFWAELLAKDGHTEVGALIEASLVGESYIRNFRKAAAAKGIRVAIEERIPQTAQDITEQVRALKQSKVTAFVHCGFGFGPQREPVLSELSGTRPRLSARPSRMRGSIRSCGTPSWGGPGLDQYDESNPVGQRFLDEYQEAYGRRPEYCVPVVGPRPGHVLLHAFADAHPLSPRGVKEALERVKMLPAASGAVVLASFGNWMRRGWVGASYLVARQLEPRVRQGASWSGASGSSERWPCS